MRWWGIMREFGWNSGVIREEPTRGPAADEGVRLTNEGLWCPSEGVWCPSEGLCCTNEGVCRPDEGRSIEGG